MAKVKSVEELKRLHLKDVKKKVKELHQKIEKRIQIVPDARHGDYSNVVRDKLENGGGLSYSSMKSFRESPLSFIEYLTGERKPKTPALILGSVVDEIVTNPKGFHKKIFVMPENVNARSNEGKAIKELYQEIAEGKLIVDLDTYEEGAIIAETIWKNDDARYYLERVKRYQIPINYTHRETKIPVRGFADFESAEEDPEHHYFIGDLKTGVSSHQNDFNRALVQFWYHGQIGVYTMAYKYKWKFPDFIHIVVEKNAPFNVNVFRSSNDLIRIGQEEVHSTLITFNYCLENNLWHKSYDFIRDEALRYFSLDLPAYYKPKLP